CQKCGYSPCTF
nr:immunoglobulin light chain junction region [Macaca mulatta]